MTKKHESLWTADGLVVVKEDTLYSQGEASKTITIRQMKRMLSI